MRSAYWLIPFMVAGLAGPLVCRAAAASGSPADPQVDAAALGAPMYPGATLDNDYGPNKYTSKDGQTDAHFITRDGFDKVYAFYKQHMPANSAKPYTSPLSGAKFEIGDFGDANYTGVTVMVETNQDGTPDGTQIDIMHSVDQP